MNRFRYETPLILTLLFATCVSAAPARVPSRTNARSGGPLADTVLATVGAHREVTVSRFHRAWNQVAPPARPDSLTPESARRFLDLLIDKEALGEAALTRRIAWSGQDSAGYDELRDRMMVQVVLDSALEATRRRLGPSADSLSQETLGIVARDSAMARLGLVWDDSLTARLAGVWRSLPRPSRDSSLMAQVRTLGTPPTVAPADTGRVIARFPGGVYRVRELLGSWYRLNPLYRPRVETSDQIRDLVKNGLFERRLREEAARRHIDRRPDIAERLATQRELNAVTRLVDREVYQKLVADSLTLQRYYREHLDDWALPLRVRLLRVVLPGRGDAGAMAVRLGNSAEAESLAASAGRGGAPLVVEVSASTDSALFSRAIRAGTGAVFGPDETRGGWAVLRVMSILPGRQRSFRESRELVQHAWYGVEGERLMRVLIARLREAAGVRVNDAALVKLVAQGLPSER